MFAATLYLNENIPRTVENHLKCLGVAHVHTLEVGNQGVTDQDQLEYSTRKQYILVTFNRQHFRKLDRDWAQGGRKHSGIILLSPEPHPELLANRLHRFIRSILPSLNTPFCEFAKKV